MGRVIIRGLMQAMMVQAIRDYMLLVEGRYYDFDFYKNIKYAKKKVESGKIKSSILMYRSMDDEAEIEKGKIRNWLIDMEEYLGIDAEELVERIEEKCEGDGCKSERTKIHITEFSNAFVPEREERVETWLIPERRGF